MDRDGTIIHYVPHLHLASQVRVFSGAAQAIKKLNKLGFLVVIITNQPAVARGFVDHKGVRQIHDALINRLKKYGTRIDRVYFCPHEHKDGCVCRKPRLGMLKEAKRKFSIDLKKSFFVGDDMRDVETGRRAKIKTILLKTGMAGKDKRFFDVKPDFVAKDLLAAAKIIAKESK